MSEHRTPENRTQEVLASKSIGNKTLLDIANTPWRKWKIGLPYAIVGGIIFALILIGLTYVAERAAAYPVCNNCSTARTHTVKDGLDKFKDEKFGHAPKQIHYTTHFKNIASQKMANKINAADAATTAKVMGTSVRVARRNQTTPDEAWEVFTGKDTCLAAGSLYYTEQDPGQRWFYGTCEGGALGWDTVQEGLTSDDVAIFICTAGIVVGTKVNEETGGGPWGYLLVGIGGAGCYWDHLLN